MIHHAALPFVSRSIDDPQTTLEGNDTRTLNLLVAGWEAGANGLVYASSSSIYCPASKVPLEESDRPEPTSGYAVLKPYAEHSTIGTTDRVRNRRTRRV